MLHELRFNFFDKQVVKDPDPQREGQYFDKFKDVVITTSTCGRGQILVGDQDGFVTCLDRQFSMTPFRAYWRSTAHLYQSRTSHTLISIGFDDEGGNPVVKVWNMDKLDAQRTPYCSRITHLSYGSGKELQRVEVTCLAVHESMQCMAIGTKDGYIFLFKGDITKDRASKPKLLEKFSGPITSIGIRSHQKTTVLFVTTDKNIYSVNISAKDMDQRHQLESFGSSGACACMTESGPNQNQTLLVAADEGIYFYEPEGRGAWLPLQGEKLLVKCYRGYLIIVGQQSEGIAKAMNREMSIVTVYNTQDKYIAYSAPLPWVVDVLYEWGALYLLCRDRRFYRLEEKDTQTKLDMLFKKNQYQLAINLAKTQQYDDEGLVNIFRQYGDHLYKKGDHDGAITQYIKTIGKLEPSYVIRQFLDAQRIYNLTSYLQELHAKQHATEDHTTLLLNCYTKLKDENKLKQFILSDGKELNFDIETAIRVLRQASYHDLALHLAERQGLHGWYMKIQLENVKNYKQALRYMGNLNFDEAKRNMEKYGRILVNELPNEATNFLKKLCTGYSQVDDQLNTVRKQAFADDFIHLFVNNSGKLLEFLESTVKSRPDSSPLVYHTLLELQLQSLSSEPNIEKRVEKERKTLTLLEDPNAKYDINQALVLCQMNAFKAGILFLYDREKLYHQILQYHMDHGEYSRVVETCRKYGSKEHHIWEVALSYFAQKEDDCRVQLREVLGHIDRENLLPPLMVIQALAQSPVCTLGVIKDFIIKRLKADNSQIAEDEKKIQDLTEETEKMKTEIEELKHSPVVFQSSNCSVCSQTLELPSVHFLCKHSYHQQCFESYSENENECPVCLPENKRILDAIKEQERNRNLHSNFRSEMETAADGFAVVADFFGKGVFNKLKLVNDYETSNRGRQPPAANERQRTAGGATGSAGSGSRGDGRSSHHPGSGLLPSISITQARQSQPPRANDFRDSRPPQRTPSPVRIPLRRDVSPQQRKPRRDLSPLGFAGRQRDPSPVLTMQDDRFGMTGSLLQPSKELASASHTAGRPIHQSRSSEKFPAASMAPGRLPPNRSSDEIGSLGYQSSTKPVQRDASAAKQFQGFPSTGRQTKSKSNMGATEVKIADAADDMNPFGPTEEAPKPASNPFLSSPTGASNPFEDTTTARSNPFEEPSTSNPNRSGQNPFEETEQNPFEEPGQNLNPFE